MVQHWNIVKFYYYEIGKKFRVEDLRNLQEKLQEEAFWESFRGLDEVFNKEILLEILFCFERSREDEYESIQQNGTSEVFEAVLRKLQKREKTSDSPHRRKLEEQLGVQLNDFMCHMPYEIALVCMEIEKEYKAFSARHRNESIKAYGNAIVPQVAFEIFKAIQLSHSHSSQTQT